MNIDNIIGKKTLILSDFHTSRLEHIVKTVEDLNSSVYSKKVTLLDCAPKRRIKDHTDKFDKLHHIKTRLTYEPRISAKNRSEIIKYSVNNSRAITTGLDEFRKRPTKIMAMNYIHLYLHKGPLALLMKTINASDTFIGTAFRGKCPFNDFEDGITRRERKLVDKLSLHMDDVIYL